MAKLFITSFVPGGLGAITCDGFYQDGDVYDLIAVGGISYDPSAGSVKTQVMSGLVAKFNETYPSHQLTSADVEFIS